MQSRNLTPEEETQWRALMARVNQLLQRAELDIDQSVTAAAQIALGKQALLSKFRLDGPSRVFTEIPWHVVANEFAYVNFIGVYLDRLEQYATAIEFWELAGERWPAYKSVFRHHIAKDLIYLGRHDQAIVACTELIDDENCGNSIRTMARYNRACAAIVIAPRNQCLESFGEAITDLEAVVSSECTEDMRSLSLLRLSAIYNYLGLKFGRDEALERMKETSECSRLLKLLATAECAYGDGRLELFLDQARTILLTYVIDVGPALIGEDVALSYTWTEELVGFREIGWIGSYSERICGLAATVAGVERSRGREELAISVWERLFEHPQACEVIRERAKLELRLWSNYDRI
jgi:tetratricopeptide (TPR) repeat protein